MHRVVSRLVVFFAAWAVSYTLLVYSYSHTCKHALVLCVYLAEVLYAVLAFVHPIVFAVWAWHLAHVSTRYACTTRLGRYRYAAALGIGVLSLAATLLSLYAVKSMAIRGGLLKPYDYFSTRSGLECLAGFALVAPVAEEIIFRQYLLGSLMGFMQRGKALLCSALIFALCHLLVTPVPVSAFVGGIVFGLIYVWRGTLSAPIAAHLGANAAIVILRQWAL